MALQCPACRNCELQPTRLEESLPALACENCSGILLSLVAYRHWREQPGSDAAVTASPADAATPVKDTLSALCCPNCARFMSKFRVRAEAGTQVALCPHCDEVRLDRGEW